MVRFMSDFVTVGQLIKHFRAEETVVHRADVNRTGVVMRTFKSGIGVGIGVIHADIGQIGAVLRGLSRRSQN